MHHLTGISELERTDIERICERAASFAEVGRRDIKKLPTLRGRTVASVFFEASTRTSTSFELAAKRLSADVISVKGKGSSLEKGESLRDTIATLDAYSPDAIVIRHGGAGAAALVRRWTKAAVVNAGDGKHQHPTQALLDVYALRSRIGDLDGKSIWIVGDVLHSRVARSCAQAFSLMGAKITLCGPPTLVPRELEQLGYEVTYDISGLADADVAYALRIQQERMSQAFVPSMDEYIAGYRIDGRRLGSRQLLMHPGPVIRGLEVAEDVIEGPNSLISEQVAAGLVVRMAILYEVLSGRGSPREGSTEISELHPSPLGEPA